MLVATWAVKMRREKQTCNEMNSYSFYGATALLNIEVGAALSLGDILII
jgi:hypothetical protein